MTRRHPHRRRRHCRAHARAVPASRGHRVPRLRAVAGVSPARRRHQHPPSRFGGARAARPWRRARASISILTREAVFYNRFGQLIYREPLGRDAGYEHPQYSIHRARLHDVLLAAVTQRMGSDAVVTGWRCTQVEQDATSATAHFVDAQRRRLQAQRGTAVVACDGLHSAIRKALHPGEGPPLYSGVNMWRGVSVWPPILTGASMIRAGWLTTGKMVIYPVANLADGRQLVNWVAEIETPHHTARDWNRRGEIGDFIGAFADWHFDWLDVPALIRAAESILEFPMVDQEPLPWWSRGRVTLMGDAAHPMYPRGSNGAGQAILDARALADALARARRSCRRTRGLRGHAAARHGGGRAHESQQSAGCHPARSVRAHRRQALRADRGRHQPRRARRDVRSLQARRGPCPTRERRSDHETRAGSRRCAQ